MEDIISNGYRLIFAPEYSKTRRSNYVYEHIVIAEKVLGKRLPTKAQVHHLDNNGLNNTNNNIVICQDRAYHAWLHQRTEALRRCGNANWLKCTYCHTYDDPYYMITSGNATHRHKNHSICTENLVGRT